ncbi:MAG: O-antigen ligase family protein [Bacilli bacterium]
MKFLNRINIKKILLIFLMIQPILDIYIFFEKRVTSIIGFSPSTIIRIVVIGILFLLIVISIKYTKKYLLFSLYIVILLVYLYLHYINVLNISSKIPSNYSFSIITELFYIIRMLLPLIIAFITYHLKITKEDVKKVVFTITIMISATIIITNILCLSISSYSTNDVLIKTNIFEWFMGANKYFTNVELSSRGIFNSANQMGTLLNILLPITCFFAITKKNIYSKIVVFLQIIALIMIGSRVSSYTWIATLFVMIIIYLFFTVVKKTYKFDKNIILYFLIVGCLCGITLQYAPIQNRYFADYYKDKAEAMENKLVLEKEKIDDMIKYEGLSYNAKELVENFIGQYYSCYFLPKIFVEEIYNYHQDPMFWYDVVSMPYSSRSDSRQIEQLITKHIYKLNDNANDKYFGMSFSRFRNAGLYLEKDFIVHFYTLGIIGSSLLVYPYLLLLIIAGGILIFKYKEKLQFDTVVYCFSLSLACVLSFFSGSVLDQLVITLILGFIGGLILTKSFKKKVGD